MPDPHLRARAAVWYTQRYLTRTGVRPVTDGPVDSRRALDALPHLVWLAGPDGTVEYLNRRCAEYAGLAVDDLLGWDWGWVMHPEDLPGTLAAWSEAVRAGTLHEIEYRLRRHDGQYRWFLTRAEPLRDADGRIIRWYGTCTDIDDHKRAEAELRAVRGLFRALVERSELGFALVGADRAVRYVSPAVGRLLGRPPGVFTGTDALDWVHPDDRAAALAALAEVMARPGGHVVVSVRLRHADGSFRGVEATGTNLLPDPDVRAISVTLQEVAGRGE